ncbi:Myb-like_DNA-binding domain-containing protein [Hexamita inflata]|uniref:Myb-like DNA-binding domain-containing protein n=1 Tax=Hexamita inflata TaxID=28002 RepID=A0AA86RJ98_9EUKA|nr:Myb-like DNA-binding domain-containing protein [Hexamita inflata]
MNLEMNDDFNFFYDFENPFGLHEECTSSTTEQILLVPTTFYLQERDSLVFNQQMKVPEFKTVVREPVKEEKRVQKKAQENDSADSSLLQKGTPERRIRWTKEEHEVFEQAIVKHGRNKHQLISQTVGTKSVMQCISHSQKFFVQLDNLFQRGQQINITDNEQKAMVAQFPQLFEVQSQTNANQIAAGLTNLAKKNKSREVIEVYVQYLVQMQKL